MLNLVAGPRPSVETGGAGNPGGPEGHMSVTTPLAFDRFGVSSERLAKRPLTLDDLGCQEV